MIIWEPQELLRASHIATPGMSTFSGTSKEKNFKTFSGSFKINLVSSISHSLSITKLLLFIELQLMEALKFANCFFKSTRQELMYLLKMEKLP